MPGCDAYHDMVQAAMCGESWVAWVAPDGVHTWRFRLAGASALGAFHPNDAFRVAFHLSLILRGRKAIC